MSDNSTSGPTSEEIIAALERTGFLLEQRAAEKLKSAGFNPILNSAFPDPETGKSREIDILASIDNYVENDYACFGVYGFVLIECKNYSSPLVLVGKSAKRSRPKPVDHFSVTFDPLAMRFPGMFEHSVKYKLLLPYASPDPQWGKFAGSQMVRMDRKSGTWTADNSSVYDGILYPLVKARQHEIGNPRRFPAGRDWEFPMITYYFPVLLTSGSVYTVAVDEDSDPQVKKAKWAQLVRTFHAKELQTTLRVDVVSFDHFEEYLESRVTGTVKLGGKALQDNPNLYNPEWLLENHGYPKDVAEFKEWLDGFRVARKDPSPPF